ncbi:hypothetical protein CHH28_02295 [Bacterioplanes sanyensis]|uniref:Endonuclease/exonuclease/phosphatase domain-containing protein n=2 Tax=Bacterioplanes sanyensis TaxID=1249553 RepID=A0A222FH64_9GAMM|nr:hypothetical protein CHH28_02295 [Bacterioplanes sanyensis]
MASSAQAQFIINELDADQAGTDSAEFIELYDGGLGNQPLDGYSLVLYNGSGSKSYNSVDLSGYSTNADGFFVVCGDTAAVANCMLDIGTNTNLIQNGADAAALYARPASDFPSNTPVDVNGVVDALVYDTNDSDATALLALLNAGQPQVNEAAGGDKDAHSNQRCGDGIARNTDGYRQQAPTPGAANQCDGIDPDPGIGACGDVSHSDYQLISSIQGRIEDSANDASPLNGQTVVVEAVVTTDLQGGQLANGDNSFQYSGYWLQQLESEYDNDAQTSEGIFVYDFRSEVSVGDRVRLQAQVSEFNQSTQLKNVADLVVCASGQSLPAPVALQLPVSDKTAWEAVEGMLVSSQQNLVVSDLFGTGYGFGNYGQFVVSSRLHFQPTEVELPGSAAAQALAAARPLDALLIDDGVAKSYPAFIPFPDESGFSASNPMRIGYQVPSVSGVMNEFRDNYTVIPNNIVIDPVAARTAAPQVALDADLVVVGMNVLNYFNGDGQGGGFPTSRGAPSAAAFEMQTAKIVAALQAMDADIVGLMEIENDGYGSDSAIASLVNALNAVQAAGDEYTYVNPGRNQVGTDAIAVGLLYRPAKVSLEGASVILDSSNSPLDDTGAPLFIDNKNRPSLIQSFRYNDTVFTLSVNHLKSKGSPCGEPNEGENGVGSCNLTRTTAAQALVQFLATNPTGVDSDATLILGDLNAYSQEDPMQVFYQGGFTNLKYTDKVSEQQPFSYSFSGFLGSLDHALASPSLLNHVVSVDAWHINSVEAPLMDYLTEANGQDFDSIDNYAAADAYRSSDHDPIVLGLSFAAANQAPQQSDDIADVALEQADTLYSIDLSQYFIDADGDALSYELDGQQAGITLLATGELQVQLTAEQLDSLPLTLAFAVTDGQASIAATITLLDQRPAQSPWQRWWQWLQDWWKSLWD